MIIYSGTKKRFVDDVRDNAIASILENEFQKHHLAHNNPGEHRAWANSLQFMRNVIDVPEIDDGCEVAIEYQIPLTSKRVDFMLAGKDERGKSHVVIIELKQWEDSQETDKPDLVMAYTGGANRLVCHPSYQAYTYAKLLENFNEDVGNRAISLKPCAYLHNYRERNRRHIDNDFYREITDLAPAFLAEDTVKLRKFIERFVVKQNDEDVLMLIDYGKLKPSKALQDSIASMLKGNQEFYMIDEQKVAYETILGKVSDSLSGRDPDKKYTIIVRGGPGTGKSVIAVQLLATLLNQGYSAAYVTKNAAPRSVYAKLLIQDDYKKGYVSRLFMPSGSFVDRPKNTFDVLICDEAHRLNEKSGLFKNKGENQAREIIHASKVSVFLIDEDQIVTTSDFGSVEMIKEQARLEKSVLIDEPESLTLSSQFRCNGSDGYLAFLDDLLGIRKTANNDFKDLDYDLRLYGSPAKMREDLRKKNGRNKARMVAGYCYDWITKDNANGYLYDIVLEDGFEAKWNFSNTSTWAIDKNSFDQVGCIHTCQGLELDYTGVIIGKDLVYKYGRVQTDYTKRAKTDQSLKGIKSTKDYDLADRIIRNTYRVLLSRGQKGCYIYCEDRALREYISERTSLPIL